ncbi:carbohydrate esterase family 9 protein [Colletotrichum chrysophilum]|uniref:Carbohydrate esterase family 9 protein n=2 Tax=Colletotrichum chrysophilum TaxID=1836956 RepID=A0AAD9EFT1_9PEZI|nr:carbohydrate esterase family 9 protein [Colletotrichum chrysophilum]
MVGKGEGVFDSSPPPYQQHHAPRLFVVRRRRGRLLAFTVLVVVLVSLSHYYSVAVQGPAVTEEQRDLLVKGLETCRKTVSRHQIKGDGLLRESNPRWNKVSGQKQTIVLRNATLFDGDVVLPDAVDIVFEKGLIKSVETTREKGDFPSDAVVYNLNRRFVTPGLVDIHSHHLELPFSSVSAIEDVNEKPQLGPITPFVRAIDGFKPYDPAIKIIASGGVSTSLILPGSGNIIGGQGYLVKNLPSPGENGEPIVEDLLLEHGIPEESRQRYLKMACGENPKHLYGHTRLGNAWLLRQHLEKARKLKSEQDAWCRTAEHVEGEGFKHVRIARFVAEYGGFPEDLELEATVALLRGEFNVNIHCYEPEDFERMLAVLHEFGVHPQAFHHALEAWQVPEFLKEQERNITIATFAENSLFKHEAYGANLRGPKILDDHGICVVLKSDHTGESNHAKYLAYQAAVSHSFGLSEAKALQSITSAGAYSIQQDHRIGFVKAGYDADLVVWDAHPLQVGATTVQVFVDGREVLDGDSTLATLSRTPEDSDVALPKVKATIEKEKREDICGRALKRNTRIVLTGIREALIDDVSSLDTSDHLAMVVTNGEITCLGAESACVSSYEGGSIVSIKLDNGYITPGLVAFGNNIGILDISSEPSTGDGSPGRKGNALNERKDLHFAKYGVHFGGRGFGRARLGGVTRAVTAPIFGGGLLQGVSVGLRTAENATVLGGGIWKNEVALHVAIGQEAKGDDTPTISSGVERLRQAIEEGQAVSAQPSSAYVRAANGALPVVVYTDDISQIILLKRDFPAVNFVIYGGHGAPLVTRNLAEAKIPVILTGNRGAPDKWEKKNSFAGPPLSPSPAQVLIDAGVLVALAVRGDSKVHGLAQEAQWAAKFAGLSEKEAIKLVSTNFNKILGLEEYRKGDSPAGNKYSGDFVVWEGNPLRGEGSVVLSVQDDGKIGDCWPDYEGAVL